MRIAFVGKGGSGKTTLSSLFLRHLHHDNLPTLAIDADINQHLCSAVGIEDPDTKPLGLSQTALKTLFAGENPLVTANQMIKTTPPGNGSFVALGLNELLSALNAYTHQHGSLTLAEVGTQTEDDLGIRCYHSKTGAVELILNHLVDGKDEFIVVDMTAGADAFASGLFDKFDLTVVVVEPTKKSVSVFNQYAQQAKKQGVVVKAVGNKILTDDDRTYLESTLGEDLLGCFTLSTLVRSEERGEQQLFTNLESENQQLLKHIQETLQAQTKDWERYLERTINIHKLNAESWASSSKGIDLTTQIDPSFSYPTLS